MITFRPHTADYNIFKSINQLNEYRLPERFYADDVIIDIGAHIGCFTFACLFRGGGKVIGFEPDKENFRLYSEHFTDYGERVRVHQLAVWRSDMQGNVHLRYSGYPRGEGATDTGGGDVIFQPPWTSLPQNSNDAVQAISLDEILREHTHVRLMKLACVGSEWPILFTATLLDRVEVICGTYKEMGLATNQISIPAVAKVKGYEHYTRSELNAFLQSHFDDVTIFPGKASNVGYFLASRKGASYLKSNGEDPPPPLYDREVPSYRKIPSFYVFSSCLCCSNHFRLPLYAKWCEALGEKPRYHRKQWEYVYICQVLYEREMLISGKSAIGFGVGNEPLVALFASYGIRVIASDIDTEKAKSLGWTCENGQHVGGQLSMLNKRKLCKPATFDEMVSFRTVDMNEIPADLGSCDFCWSSCAFEHLGSIRKGMDFVLNSSKLLNPGGIAVHTTEFNLSSNDATMENESCVIFRKRDIENLTRELKESGYAVEIFDYYPGTDSVDKYVDTPPYTKSEPHLRLSLAEYVATSIGIIIHRPAQ